MATYKIHVEVRTLEQLLSRGRGITVSHELRVRWSYL